MKVGILTIFSVPNYGAMLQSYGLSSWLCSQGLEAEVVDYRQPDLEKYFRFKWSMPPAVRNWMRISACKKFVEKRIRKSSIRLHTADDFPKIVANYDAFITGSDQVWFTGPVQYYDPLYFLDFEASNARKISYAASVGGVDTFGEFENRVRRSLNAIDYIGVRDTHTASVIAPLTNKKITQVVDPVFLFDFNDLLRAERPQKDPYILVFGDFRGPLAEVVSSTKRALGIRDVVSLQYPNRFASRRVASPGPVEWLNWFRHADYVVTSYFHGTVVAAKFKRPFISVPTPGRRLKVATLLDSLDLSLRCATENVILGTKAAEIAGNKINWQESHRLLDERIGVSKKFLLDALT